MSSCLSFRTLSEVEGGKSAVALAFASYCHPLLDLPSPFF
jgi:hypothetical protein